MDKARSTGLAVLAMVTHAGMLGQVGKDDRADPGTDASAEVRPGRER